ncbi:MAG: hypothetical protein LBT70_02165 [Holosporaceae bacterium]|jgi:hypothetical protein|nr:hypothetical protein [Holosporaceae bacterium]
MNILKILSALFVLFSFNSDASVEEARSEVCEFIANNASDQPATFDQSIRRLEHIFFDLQLYTPQFVRQEEELAGALWDAIYTFVPKVTGSPNHTQSQLDKLFDIYSRIRQSTLYAPSCGEDILDQIFIYLESARAH